MPIEHAEVEDLWVTASSSSGCSLSVLSIAVLRVLLLLPLAIGLQRTAGWRSRDIHRRSLCKGRQVYHTSLVGVFIVGSCASGDGDAEMVFGTSERDADDCGVSVGTE